jgi:hypothetical protein
MAYGTTSNLGLDLQRYYEKQLRQMAGYPNRALPGNELDMRPHAIEGLADFMALLRRSKEQARPIDTVLITPEQFDALRAELHPDMFDKTPTSSLKLYGCLLKVKPLDAPIY